MENYDVLLFDLDGTLTASAEGIINGYIYALEKIAVPVPSREQLRMVVGPPLEYSFDTFFGLSKEQAREAIGYYRAYYADKGAFENRLYDGVPELLEKLKSAGKKLYLATTKAEKYAHIIPEHYGISGYFDFICGSDQESRRDKASVIRCVLSAAGTNNPDRCIMIGDRKFDVLGAAQCGLGCIGVLYGYGDAQELQAAGAKHIVSTVEELGQFFGV